LPSDTFHLVITIFREKTWGVLSPSPPKRDAGKKICGEDEKSTRNLPELPCLCRFFLNGKIRRHLLLEKMI
jgi:hypothetical protein